MKSKRKKQVGKTRRDGRSFKWSESREKAAQLVAADNLTNEQIAAEVGVSRQALSQWKAMPEFVARVDQHLSEFRAHIRSSGIAITENRVGALQDRWRRMKRIIEERSADPKMASVPGGKTGLLVHNVKSVGSGVTAERVDLYEVDAALLKEMREHEKQAAQELGQWTEKLEHSGEMKFHPITLDGDKETADEKVDDNGSDGDDMGSSPKASAALP